MPITVLESLPFGEDQDSTLVQSNPEDWITSPFILDLLDREGSSASSSTASSAKADVPPALPPQELPSSDPVPAPEVKGINQSFKTMVAQQASPAKGLLTNQDTPKMVETTEATKQVAHVVEESSTELSSAIMDEVFGFQSLHMVVW